MTLDRGYLERALGKPGRFDVRRSAGPVASALVARGAASRTAYMRDTLWMDAALQAAGIETVVIGPACAGAHAAVEWVDLDSCMALAEILARAASSYCRATL